MTTTRLYRDEIDLQAMIDLIKAIRPASWLADFPGIADLHGLMGRPAIRQCTRLWHDNDGRLAAFAFVYTTYRNLYFEMLPDEAIERQIVDWGLTCLQEAGYESPLTLDTSCRDDDDGRLALLRRHGFALQTMRTLHMARSLADPIAAPDLPSGFRIQPLAGESEVEARVALHRAAFGTENMTVADYLAEMRAPEYEPALDLVVVAEDGRLAAFCTGSISAEENTITGRRDGYTDPVGTHPDFRRRGLARALLLAGMALLKERGMETAVLGTSSQNIAMQKTAESVGFTTQWSKIWLAKFLPPSKQL
ncbi:MAG: GNAT family N-acetyltransferase [Chloroflexi bacterium]|nr:GNAT family N-acetyltransferase [Chloroflexota bacterium]